MTIDPTTLSVDCGGTRLKAALLDASGEPLGERVRIRTPYPLSPTRFVSEVVSMTGQLGAFDRAVVGMPGMIRDGRVVSTPHYPTKGGPFSAKLPDLVARWADFDAAAAFSAAFGRPTLVLNDAEVHGFGVVRGIGLEIMVTLGTGFGVATYEDGRLAPHVEWSQHPFRQGQSYDLALGNAARKRIGNEVWNRRVRLAVQTLRPVMQFDRLYVGGGNAKHLSVDLGPGVTLVPGSAGLTGGARAWELRQETG